MTCICNHYKCQSFTENPQADKFAKNKTVTKFCFKLSKRGNSNHRKYESERIKKYSSSIRQKRGLC